MSDYIEGYKQGFKEGVTALQTQLKNLHEEGKDRVIQRGKHILPEVIVLRKGYLDEICKELEGENAARSN